MREFILGDCNEVLKSIPDKSINLFLEDMPYNTTACHWEYKVDLEQYWALRLSKLADKGCFVLTASQPFTTDLINSNRKMFKYEWIWEKDNSTQFLDANKKPLKKHENVLIFYKDLPIYNPQFSKGKPYIAKRNNPSTPNYGKFNATPTFSDGRRYPNSILKVNTERGYHPTQKPVDLFRYLIKTYTNENDTVFDGYAGSGTTAIACEMENRNYTCVEKDEDYHRAATKRLKDHKSQFRLKL